MDKFPDCAYKIASNALGVGVCVWTFESIRWKKNGTDSVNALLQTRSNQIELVMHRNQCEFECDSVERASSYRDGSNSNPIFAMCDKKKS